MAVDTQDRLQELAEKYGTASFKGTTYIILDDPSVSNQQLVSGWAIRMDDTPDEQGRMDLYLMDWIATGEDDCGYGSYYDFDWDDPDSVWATRGTYNIITGELIPD